MKQILRECLISIVLPVYNGSSYLEECIKSILGQSLKNFEFIIINDGSTDDTDEIIQKYLKKDLRINYISRENKGLIFSLNEGISISRGKYIARIDADDIATYNRLEKQYQFLENNPDVFVCGTEIQKIDSSGKHIKTKTILPHAPEETLAFSFFRSPVIHPTVMMRNDRNIIFDINYLHAEDYALWIKLLLLGYKIVNIPFIGLYYRIHSDSITNTKAKEMKLISCKIKYKLFNKYFPNTKKNIFNDFCDLTTRLFLVDEKLFNTKTINRYINSLKLIICNENTILESKIKLLFDKYAIIILIALVKYIIKNKSIKRVKLIVKIILVVFEIYICKFIKKRH